MMYQIDLEIIKTDRSRRMRSHGSNIFFCLQGYCIIVIILPLLARTHAFSSPVLFNALQRRHHHHNYPYNLEERVKASQIASKVKSHENGGSINDSHNEDEDEILLKQVSANMLKDLCRQNGLSTIGTKQDMLLRLRAFAQQQAEIDRERRRMQKERIERGVDDAQGNGKAKYKIISKDDDEELNDGDDDIDGVFYFSLPGQVPDAQNKTLAKVTSTTIKKTMNPQVDSRGVITAPPPPPGVEANEDGEITVTTYSSTDQNDLTGIAAHHTASSGNDRALAGGYSRTDDFGADPLRRPENTLAGGPFGDQSGAKRKKATDKQFEEACDVISELVYSLLSMTGAPGFQEQFSEGVTPFKTDEEKREEFESTSTKNPLTYSVEFVGFDPSRVPTQLITQVSTFLRVRNGEALRKVLNEVELQAIGFDGINGDDKRKGGGHYLEVTKVGTFLEGFRKAEIRRIARETITMLLDQLVTGGVKGLDQMLMTMARGSEDTGDCGELNDSLVKYLDDAIRDQEKKVEQLIGQQGVLSQNKVTRSQHDDPIDELSKLWNVTTDEDGMTVESLDPNEPRVKKALEREIRDVAQIQRVDIPTHPSKILLNMLILLKERIKAEAAFSNDEKGRNLRILAYCLHAKDDRERESILMENMGTNLDVSTSPHVMEGYMMTFKYHTHFISLILCRLSKETGLFLSVAH
jgi:hypothetical protein